MSSGSVKVTLVKDWEIKKSSVTILTGAELLLSPTKEKQLEAAGVIENRKRTIKEKDK